MRRHSAGGTAASIGTETTYRDPTGSTKDEAICRARVRRRTIGSPICAAQCVDSEAARACRRQPIISSERRSVRVPPGSIRLAHRSSTRQDRKRPYAETDVRSLIAGNWKMHGLKADLHEIDSIAALAASTQPHVDILICPPASLLAAAARTAADRIAVGGQDCSPEVSGAHTGDISAEMLKDAGAGAVIIGHSERRQHHGETDSLQKGPCRKARRTACGALRRRDARATR